MFIHNKTRISESVLQAIVDYCVSAVGLIDCNVRVTITKGRTIYCKGLATRYAFQFSDRRYHDTKVCIPKSSDVIAASNAVFEVMIHEFSHILDYQKMDNGEFVDHRFYKSDTSLRRINHDLRPQEIRAENCIKEVREKISKKQLQSPDDLILDLAIEIEEKYPPKT